MRDLADVQDLIIALNLPLELKEKLDKSVRPEYRRFGKQRVRIPAANSVNYSANLISYYSTHPSKI
jgi:hypothetical protein